MYVHSLQVHATDNGEQFIMATYTQQPCGCKITGGGTLQRPLTIEYCPTHAAAPDLLDACKTAIQQCTTLLVSQGWNERWDSITGGEWAGPVITNIMQSADAAIAEAEGGQQ